MPYKYAVIWFKDAKFYLAKYPRSRNSECRMFNSLERAIKFSKSWIPPALIYRLHKNIEGVNNGEK
jgi:hypothetical protein